MGIKGLPKDVPWITKDGYFDVIKFPINGVLDRVINGNDEGRKKSDGCIKFNA